MKLLVLIVTLAAFTVFGNGSTESSQNEFSPVQSNSAALVYSKGSKTMIHDIRTNVFHIIQSESSLNLPAVFTLVDVSRTGLTIRDQRSGATTNIDLSSNVFGMTQVAGDDLKRVLIRITNGVSTIVPGAADVVFGWACQCVQNPDTSECLIAGGPGAIECSVEGGIEIIGGGVSVGCSVKCGGEYSACCGKPMSAEQIIKQIDMKAPRDRN